MKAKTAAQSKVIMSQIMMPNQANPAGNIHGGELMKLMDLAAYAVTRRHARTNVVTARVDELQFHLPIRVGELVVCTAKIVFVGNTSMEVAVTVEVDDLDNDSEPRIAQSAYFTMVALDYRGKPVPVPQLIVMTKEEKTAFDEGKKRYEFYKAKAKKESCLR